MKDRLGEVAFRREAFEKLTQERLDRAYRLAAAILGSDEEGQDAVHDAAVHAWTRWAGLRDQDRFEGWFDRIVLNVCRDRLRRRGTTARILADLAKDEEDTASHQVHGASDLRHVLSQLSADHKIVIVLRFLEDQSLEEIAARTGLRVGTVKSRLHYALRECRAAYDAAQRPGAADHE